MFQVHEFLERCSYDPRLVRLLRHDAFLCFAAFQTRATSPYAGEMRQAADIIARESAWKAKLGTRAHGLNEN